MKLYQRIASTINARALCATNGKWFDRHTEKLERIQRDILPSGSGIDCGTVIDLDRSTGERIVMHASYHHTGESGMYDGWTEHTITARASLMLGMDIKISGRNRNDIKYYLGDVYHTCLMEEYVPAPVAAAA